MKGTCSHCGQPVEHVCIWCGEPAIAFCDAWLGGDTKDGCFSLELPHYTCDAPICAKHRMVAAILCGKDPDTLDHCPAHQDREVTVHSAAKSREEAERMRRAAWAKGHHHHMRAVTSSTEQT